MEFPITELLDYESSVAWIIEHFHPVELKYPRGRQPKEQARKFLRTKRNRPFKGVNKGFLSGYIAKAEFRRNLKRISPAFIATLVASIIKADMADRCRVGPAETVVQQDRHVLHFMSPNS